MGTHNSLLVVERREGNLYEVNKEEGSTLDVVFLPNFSYFIAPFSYSLCQTPLLIWMHLFLGHVQQTDRVAITVEVCPHCVQSFVELTLNIRELFKHFVSRPQKQLYTKHHKNLISQYVKTFL